MTTNRNRLVLALQGGGALGAYQAGILEGANRANVEFDEICGASIGAVNAAIFLGNSPAKRIPHLRNFWEMVSLPSFSLMDAWMSAVPRSPLSTVYARTRAELETGQALVAGVPNFFAKRLIVPHVAGLGSPSHASFFDTQPLANTLKTLCDVDLLNANKTRLSVVASNVETGQPRFFDTADERVTIAMVMASGALPPWFPAIEIEGEWFWDGALVTGAPIRRFFDTAPESERTIVLRADLWKSVGPIPDNISDVDIRLKNVEHASRSQYVMDALNETQRLKQLLAYSLSFISPESRQRDPELSNASALANWKPVSVLSLDYNQSPQLEHFKDGQFGKAAIEYHWEQGRSAFDRTLPQIRRLIAGD